MPPLAPDPPVLFTPDAPDGLRVALLTHRFPVVSETFVIRLAADLAGAGCDLRVLAIDCDAGPAEPAHALVREAGLEARTTRASPAGRLGLCRALRLAREGRRAAPLLLAAAKRAAPARAMAVTRLMAAQPPFDVVHAQFATLGLTAMRHRCHGTLRARSSSTCAATTSRATSRRTGRGSTHASFATPSCSSPTARISAPARSRSAARPARRS